jgi:Protein of unknown function (DUF2541)
MTRRLFLIALVAVLIVPAVAEAGRRWELLGTLTVSDAVDHDTLVVTAVRGTFRRIKIQVEDRAVQFREVKIHFGSGDSQNVELRRVIPAGGESRLIDIEGRGDRVIRSIEFLYDAQSLGGKAKVKVWAKN